MKLKMLRVASVSVSFVLGVGFIGCKQPPQQPPPQPTPKPPPVKGFIADSPLDMGGGSIYACSQTGWTPAAHGQPYDYTGHSNSADINQISTEGVTNLSSTLPDTLPGWTIRFSNRDQTHPKKDNAVTISSDPSSACFSDAGCSSPGVGDNRTAYLGCRHSDCKWIKQNKQSWHFHDKTCDSPGHSGEDDTCDHAVLVTFQFQNQTVTGTCQNGKCVVHLGPGIGTTCAAY